MNWYRRPVKKSDETNVHNGLHVTNEKYIKITAINLSNVSLKSCLTQICISISVFQFISKACKRLYQNTWLNSITVQFSVEMFSQKFLTNADISKEDSIISNDTRELNLIMFYTKTLIVLGKNNEFTKVLKSIKYK